MIPKQSVLALAILATAVLGASPPPPLPSLRHLVFAIAVRSSQVTERFDSGEGRDGTGNGNLGTGPQNGLYAAHGDVETRAIVDVVAATSDGGLVVDVVEGGPSGVPVRCTISSDGIVVYDPNRPVGDGARIALRALARGTIPVGAAVGDRWRRDEGDGATGERRSYRYDARAGADVAKLSYEGRLVVSGGRFIARTIHGTLAYDTVRLVPNAISETDRDIETIATQRRSTDRAIDIRLLEDSFGER